MRVGIFQTKFLKWLLTACIVIIAFIIVLNFIYQSLATLCDTPTSFTKPIGTLLLSRSHQATLLLKDGEIAVIGGFYNANQVPAKNEKNAGIEIFDPIKRHTSFASFSTLAIRQDHSAALLPDGRVLALGGMVLGKKGFKDNYKADIIDFENFKVSQIIQDPNSGPPYWKGSNWNRSATRLPDGRMVLIGGDVVSDGIRKLYSTIEIFEPEVQKFRHVALIPRIDGHKSILVDNRIWIFTPEKMNSFDTRDISILDIPSGVFKHHGFLNINYRSESITVFKHNTHELLLLGTPQIHSNQQDTLKRKFFLELINIKTGKAELVKQFSVPGAGHFLHLLPDHNTLILGGKAIYLFESTKQTISLIDRLQEFSVTEETQVLVGKDGKVYILGSGSPSRIPGRNILLFDYNKYKRENSL